MDGKKGGLCAVICEYNPFHFGHLRQIEELKSRGYRVMCIMSGCLVQRGEVAVTDKYTRAYAAVASGADVVLELPPPYCMMSAPDFASSGVAVAAAVGADTLAFGCEDPGCVIAAARALAGADDAVNALIRENKSLSYPKARELYLDSVGVDGKIASKPNNTLAAEYIRAAERLGAIRTLPLLRDQSLESATSLRSLPYGEMCRRLPGAASGIFAAAGEFRTERLGVAVIAALRTMEREQLRKSYDMTDQLASRMTAAAETETTLSGLVDACVSATVTRSKVRRAALSAFFGFTAKDGGTVPPFTVLLAARKNATDLLRGRGGFVVTKPADAHRVLPETSLAAFNRAMAVERVVLLCREGASPMPETGTPRIVG